MNLEKVMIETSEYNLDRKNNVIKRKNSIIIPLDIDLPPGHKLCIKLGFNIIVEEDMKIYPKDGKLTWGYKLPFITGESQDIIHGNGISLEIYTPNMSSKTPYLAPITDFLKPIFQHVQISERDVDIFREFLNRISGCVITRLARREDETS